MFKRFWNLGNFARRIFFECTVYRINKHSIVLSTKVFIYSVFLKFETAIRIKEPDIKQHKIDMIKFDSENETSKQAIVINKKVNLLRKFVKFTFFLPCL